MVVALGTVVAGCGQKGGLYIPDDKREKSKKKALNLKPKQRARGLV
jgi:predicted small lipoprotein YifL